MGRVSQLLILASLSLVAGVALGQQGFIVEPWRKAPVAPAVKVTAQPMPGSGLPPPPVAISPRKPEVLPAVASFPAPEKWSPPIVELLVDPWAKTAVAAPTARPRWEPRASEIIDPWAGTEPLAPRVASHPSKNRPSTIF